MKKTIRNYMTPSAHTIGVNRSLVDAHRPVLDGGKWVGIVTQRDLHLIETLNPRKEQHAPHRAQGHR